MCTLTDSYFGYTYTFAHSCTLKLLAVHAHICIRVAVPPKVVIAGQAPVRQVLCSHKGYKGVKHSVSIFGCPTC
eukprot:671622-Pelagomonas_calceolata.AAC.2